MKLVGKKRKKGEFDLTSSTIEERQLWDVFKNDHDDDHDLCGIRRPQLGITSAAILTMQDLGLGSPRSLMWFCQRYRPNPDFALCSNRPSLRPVKKHRGG